MKNIEQIFFAPQRGRLAVGRVNRPIYGRLRTNMPHCPKPRRQISRCAKQTNNHQPDNARLISDAVRSWIKNVIAPALVKTYLAEQALREGKVHA